jgi:hypothetical protein
VKKALDNEEYSITLFAPDDHALKAPHKPHHHHAYQSFANGLGSERLEQALEEPSTQEGDGEGRREKALKFLNIVLRYHALTSKLTKRELADKSTVATDLPVSSETGEKFRIRVKPKWRVGPEFHPTLELNFYSHVKGPSIVAKNGTL